VQKIFFQLRGEQEPADYGAGQGRALRASARLAADASAVQAHADSRHHFAVQVPSGVPEHCNDFGSWPLPSHFVDRLDTVLGKIVS
jgi:hypothetical protein